MARDDTFLALDEVLDAKRALNVVVWRSAWRPLLFSVIWGAGAAALFIGVTWLSGFIDPIRTNRVYSIVGIFSFVFFGSWPIIDFVRALMANRRALASIEARIRAGENVLRPNPPLNPDAPSGAPVS